jgi:endonuclease/exonuclease/phosphatase family metal-dependent hydrolase
MPTVRVATYNIHKCVGIDRRYSPERVGEVVSELDADVVALQEVVCHSGRGRREHQAEFLADELGMRFCLGENRKHHGGGYGNVILSRLPIVSHQNHDISVPGREPRGSLRAEIEVSAGISFHLVNVHMGTSYFERRQQVRKLLTRHALDDPKIVGKRIVVGDFNEWVSGMTTRLMCSRFKCVDPREHLGSVRTFPGIFPLLHLDHIYFDAKFSLLDASLHRSKKARTASDHLPIVADFEF